MAEVQRCFLPASQSHGLSMKGCRSTVRTRKLPMTMWTWMFPGTVVPIRVGADDGGMTGEIFLAELQAEGLRPLHGQAVLYCVLRVEADDIMVGLHVLPPTVLAVFAIGNQAGHSKRRFAALKGVEQVRIPQLGSALLVQNGQTGVLVVLKGEIAFGGGIVRVFRGQMLDGCHTVHQPFLRLSAESS